MEQCASATGYGRWEDGALYIGAPLDAPIDGDAAIWTEDDLGNLARGDLSSGLTEDDVQVYNDQYWIKREELPNEYQPGYECDLFDEFKLIEKQAESEEPKKEVMSDQIPRFHTPFIDGIYGYDKMPTQLLDDCTEPISKGVPDWRSFYYNYDGDEISMQMHIEQCGDRIVQCAFAY